MNAVGAGAQQHCREGVVYLYVQMKAFVVWLKFYFSDVDVQILLGRIVGDVKLIAARQGEE